MKKWKTFHFHERTTLEAYQTGRARHPPTGQRFHSTVWYEHNLLLTNYFLATHFPVNLYCVGMFHWEKNIYSKILWFGISINLTNLLLNVCCEAYQHHIIWLLCCCHSIALTTDCRHALPSEQWSGKSTAEVEMKFAVAAISETQKVIVSVSSSESIPLPLTGFVDIYSRTQLWFEL